MLASEETLRAIATSGAYTLIDIRTRAELDEAHLDVATHVEWNRDTETFVSRDALPMDKVRRPRV